MAPPTTVPGGNPVTELPGETPRLPVMTLGPVFVTVDPPRTAKLCEVPRDICASAGNALVRTITKLIANTLRDDDFILDLPSYSAPYARCGPSGESARPKPRACTTALPGPPTHLTSRESSHCSPTAR